MKKLIFENVIFHIAKLVEITFVFSNIKESFVNKWIQRNVNVTFQNIAATMHAFRNYEIMTKCLNFLT